MYAMRYGTLPLTRPVGGLADTVVDASGTIDGEGATGFTFREPDAANLLAGLGRVAERFRDQATWRRMQHAAMTRDFGWDMSARQYIGVYDSLLPEERVPDIEPKQAA
jgi:starch synthase